MSVADSYHLGDRTRSDGCPGALSMHKAKDGRIGRVRAPGGRVTSRQWEALAHMAETFGDGHIHLTTRGNIQIRGISEGDMDAFAEACEAGGFLPSREHDKVRNIISSPMAHSRYAECDVPWIVAELDDALIASRDVIGLSGRTLFGIDSGEGDIMAQQPDFGVVLSTTNPKVAQIIVGGCPIGLFVSHDDAAGALVAAASRWQEIRGTAWRVQEKPEVLPDLIDAITTAVECLDIDRVTHDGARDHANAYANTANTIASPQRGAFLDDPRPIGWLPHPETGEVSLGCSLAFAHMSADAARILAAVDRPIVVTPWHSLVVHDLPEAVAERLVEMLAPRGVLFDQQSPWVQVSACPGIATCEKSHSDTRADAVSFIRSMVDATDEHTPDAPRGHNNLRVHFSGCVRRCGHPQGAYVDYLATADGEYEVTEVTSPTPV